jgi:hypothetical protein
MPITAALSRTLHEALGDEAAADLVDWMQAVDTHRAELRELSELHYARFDSRMTELRQVTDARLDAFRHELRADITTLRMETQAAMGDLKVALAGVDSKIDNRFAEAQVTSANLEAKIDRRFTEFVRWSFLFWCGAIAAAALAHI